MNRKLKDLMLPFYFGSVNEEERLFVEREILTDTEVLVDYLDLKRKVEAAPLPNAHPSPSLWEKLRPKSERQKRTWISISLCAAVAAGLAFFFLIQPVVQTTEMIQPSADRALFDSSAELPVSSGVL